MSLLEKFEEFEVISTDRICEKDQEWLNEWQMLYDLALDTYQRWYDIYKGISYTKEQKEKFGSYSDVFVNSLQIVDKLMDLQVEYYEKIYHYFMQTYHVTLEIPKYWQREDLKEKYQYFRGESIQIVKQQYAPVLDELLSQLGGNDFKDREIQELKEKMKQATYNQYHDKWYISVKGNRISYQGYLYVKHFYGNTYRIENDSFLRAFLHAYSIIEYGKIYPKVPELETIGGYSIDLSEEQLKNGLALRNSSTLELMKIYKNGRVDLKFKTPEQARKFAREWCGYPC